MTTTNTSGLDRPGDDTLMVRYRDEGDDAAFDELVRRNEAGVLRFLRGRTPDVGLAEDALAETFVRVVRGRHRFERRPGGGFRAWLMTIARRVSVDDARARKRDAGLMDRLEGEPVVGKPQPVRLTDPEATLARAEQAAWLNAALRRLSSTHRTVLLLYYRHDLDTHEIAEVLDLGPQQVRDRIAYGRTLLRRVLERGADAHVA